MKVRTSCLVVSRDAEVIHAVAPLLQGFDISMDLIDDVAKAAKHLNMETYEGLVVDGTLPGSHELMEQGNQIKGFEKRMKIVAIMSEEDRVRSYRQTPAAFVVFKPLDTTHALRALRMSLRTMRVELRRAERRPVDFAVSLNLNYRHVLTAKAVNLSMTGMCVRLSEQTLPRKDIRIRFQLPLIYRQVEAKCDITRIHPGGEVGIKFTDMPRESREALRQYLDTFSAAARFGDAPSRGELEYRMQLSR
jgi:DNA-binding response OmpR family regulator